MCSKKKPCSGVRAPIKTRFPQGRATPIMYHLLASSGRVNEAAILLLSQKCRDNFGAVSVGNQRHAWKSRINDTTAFILFLFAASLARMGLEDWKMEAAFMPLRTLLRPGQEKLLKSTICARWPIFVWFLPIWRCKSLIWLRSRPQVVGDGNFAVVRVCYSRVTRKEFAVKIIDKVKACHRHRHRHRHRI